MEMLIIAVVALVAFAFVLVPLFRRTPRGAGQPDEFTGDDEAAAAGAVEPTRADTASSRPGEADLPDVDPVRGRGVVPPMAAGPVTPVDAAGTTVPADEGMVAKASSPAAPDAGVDDVELEVQRYRAALRAGTLCRKCGQANPADSKFCFDCGAALPLAEAREFD
ncbi:MAG TPA: zinc ribbon domain-containing protein [Longimicrobiales bacterium]|nr:zinc ribbon domain-containing protein [Longimicrobiales bacterium]